MKKLRSKTLSSVLVLISVVSTGAAGVSGSALAGGKKVAGVDVFAASLSGHEFTGDSSQPLSFLHDKPVISPSSLELLKIDERTLSVEFSVSAAEAKVINGFLDKYPEKRMAFVKDGKLLFSPVIKARLTGEGVRVSFNDRAEFEYVVKTLAPQE